MPTAKIQIGLRLLALFAAFCLAAPAVAEAQSKKSTKAWKPWNGKIPPAPKHVDVKKGDTLSGYAGKYLWPLIWIMNKDTVDNPHLIRPGQRINMPPNDGLVGGMVENKEPERDRSQLYLPPIAEVMFSTPGEVRYFRNNGDEVQLYTGDPIYGAGTIHTDSGTILVKTRDGAIVKIFDHSQVLVNTSVEDKEKNSLYRLFDHKKGRAFYRLPKYPDPSYRVEVKTAQAMVDPQSRAFEVNTDGIDTIRISAFDGKLRVVGRSRFVDVPADHGVSISQDGKRMAETRLPDAPVMVAPDGVTGETVEFKWKPVRQADSYRLQIGSDREITDLIFIGTVFDDTAFEMDLRNSGEYYWIVEAVNELGFSSAPQVPMRFTVSEQFVGRE